MHKKPEIIREEAKVCKEEIHTRLVKRIQEVTEDIKLEEAEVIVSVGKGIGSAENLERVEKFAEKIGGTLACSRGLVEEGWLPPYYQVGQSGKTVSPKIYFAIGISGAIQHLAGISRAKKVIAINMDPQADIFKRADYGIVGDYKEILPLLGDRLRKDGMETFA